MLIIKKEHINLSIYSDYIKEYPKLLDLFKEFKRTQNNKNMKEEYIADLKNKDKETYLLLHYGFKDFIDEVSLEWKQHKKMSDIVLGEQCELCGNEKTKYLFKIVNIKNNNELKVGSSCINKFPKIEYNKKDIKESKSKYQIIERKKIINAKYENEIIINNCKDIEGLLDFWRTYFLEFDILLPKDIKNNFDVLISESCIFYDKFVNSKISIKKLDDFNEYIKRINNLKENAINFYNENYNNRYICDKKIIYWINRTYNNHNNIKKDDIIKSIIDNDGFINEKIANKIYSINFVNKFNYEIHNLFQSNNFKLIEINEDNVIISYKTYENINIRFYSSLKKFVENFSKIFYTDCNSIGAEYIIDKFKFILDDKNRYRYISIINDRIKGTKENYYFKSEEEINNYNRIIVERYDKECVELGEEIVFENLKLNIDKDRKHTKYNVEKFLSKISNWKNKEADKEYNKTEILKLMNKRI